MANGILIVDKPAGWTSQDVAAKLRGVFHERRIGHSGTLDPMATGVLVLFVGRATRAVEFAESDSKEYLAGLRLGLVTNTQDTSGETLETHPVSVTREQLDAAAAGFLGAPLRCLACEALERDGFQAVDPEELDAVVVPLVAFDDAGRRLGYGGGNYDQLLPRLRADAAVVGIAFDEQRVKTVPCEPHDIALPRVVSG